MIVWNKKDLESYIGKYIIICTNCGWLVSEPEKYDITCPNCLKDYKDTKSNVEFLKKDK